MPTLSQAITTFLQIERRPQTNDQYRKVLSRMALAIGASNRVERITYEILLDYQSELRRQVKPSTVSTYTSILMSFFNWCAKRDYCADSPAADLVRKTFRRTTAENRAIPPDELLRMVEYARLTSPRNYALLLLLADSGCRVSALCGLTRKNLHLESLYADVIEKGGVPARILFGSQTAAALDTWLRIGQIGDTERVFALTRTGVSALIRVISRKTGASRDWFPHAFRHAVGHAFAAAGVPPTITARKLNHRNIATTLAHYYPDNDPYLEQVSSRLSLASLKSAEELRAPQTATITPLKKAGNG